MKYTKSKDGVMRANVSITLRYTREELQAIRERAKKEGDTLKEWLWSQASLAVEGAMCEHDGNYEQRYGRGGE